MLIMELTVFKYFLSNFFLKLKTKLTIYSRQGRLILFKMSITFHRIILMMVYRLIFTIGTKYAPLIIVWICFFQRSLHTLFFNYLYVLLYFSWIKIPFIINRTNMDLPTKIFKYINNLVYKIQNRFLTGIFCPIFFDKFYNYFYCFFSFFSTYPTLFLASSTIDKEFRYLISIPEAILGLGPP